MNAKERASFINSVASGAKVPCPTCNTLNDADAKYCSACGKALSGVSSHGKEEPKRVQQVAFEPVQKREEQPKQMDRMASKGQTVSASEAQNEDNIFAKGLPPWDIVPPQIMIRRKKRK